MKSNEILETIERFEKNIGGDCKVYFGRSFSGNLVIQVYWPNGFRFQRYYDKIDVEYGLDFSIIEYEFLGWVKLFLLENEKEFRNAYL